MKGKWLEKNSIIQEFSFKQFTICTSPKTISWKTGINLLDRARHCKNRIPPAYYIQFDLQILLVYKSSDEKVL